MSFAVDCHHHVVLYAVTMGFKLNCIESYIYAGIAFNVPMYVHVSTEYLYLYHLYILRISKTEYRVPSARGQDFSCTTNTNSVVNAMQ